MAGCSDRLKGLRICWGLSQSALADSLGVSQRAYSFYESGKRNFSIGFLIRLADFYGISADYILGRTDVTATF